jgi:Thioredoxin
MSALSSIPLALTTGNLIFIGFLVVFFFAIVFSYYTRRGSGISQTPYRAPHESSDSEKPSELAHDTAQDIRAWDRGVAGRHRRSSQTALEIPDDEELLGALRTWRRGTRPGQLAELDRSEPARGPDGGVDLVVFWDYATSDSHRLATALVELRESMQVCETALHLPVADARPLALVAALAAEAARTQDAFWAAHDALLERPPRDEPAVLAVGKVTADPDRFRSDLERQTGRERVLAHIRLAAASGVHAVPTVFIGETRYDGEPEASELISAIERVPKHRRTRPSSRPSGPGAAPH